MKTIGIDCGTTTLSLVSMDTGTGRVTASVTKTHGGFLSSSEPDARIQDPAETERQVRSALAELIRKTGTPDAIGITGQMHGMLYTDSDGSAVSPLYTWQNRYGDRPYAGEKSYAGYLRENGCKAAAGFGLTTHFFLGQTGRIPEKAGHIVTGPDYIAMRLCGLKKPVIAKDMAASWGGFDLKNGVFDTQALERAGVDISFLPALSEGHPYIGETVPAEGIPGGIPVTAAFGDNQASFIGATGGREHALLLNIGTGSQISMAADRFCVPHGQVELRPCEGSPYLLVGAALCGGRAYAMLEQFYRSLSGKDDMYAEMEKHARAFLSKYGAKAAWEITTTFSGTRTDPARTGRIEGITGNNFCPGAMTLGMIRGIVNELVSMYREIEEISGQKAEILIGSGNGIRRNALLRETAEELFGMPMTVSEQEEEAAAGAALMAAKNIK